MKEKETGSIYGVLIATILCSTLVALTWIIVHAFA